MVPLQRGVPQGSVLAPLLYVIFTNEMTETIKRNNCGNQTYGDRSKLFETKCSECEILTIYADDSTYVVGNRSRQENQQIVRRSIYYIKLFLNDKQLVINMPKISLTECMIKQKYGRTLEPPPTLTVEKEPGVDTIVAQSSYIRIFGANVQGNLMWQAYLEKGEKALLPAMGKHLGHIRHKGRLIPMRSRKSLARGMILSRLTYLMPLWGGAAKSYITRAQGF